MPRVRYTGGSTYNLRDGPTWADGDTHDVGEATADRLTDDDRFERVDDGGDDDSDSGAAAGDREALTPTFDPGEYSVPDLRDELDDRDLSHDELVTILAAEEEEGKNRTTAKDAILSRIDSQEA